MSDIEDFSEEDGDINEEDHQNLINSIASIDTRQRIKKPTRTERVNEVLESETQNINDKVEIWDLVKLLQGTSGQASLGRKLKEAKKSTAPLTKPLPKAEAERIQRTVHLEKTKTELDRWNAIVATQQSLDHVSFPLRPIVHKITPTDSYLSKFKLKSDLEKELEELNPVVEEQKEDENLHYPMTMYEMIEHRKQAAKLRAQQSYMASKAKWEGKIKCKKYHRIQKRQKIKEQLQEFEKLQKTNPEEALKKLEEIERARAEERHTLRHKNTGKWAKSKLIRAKYDKDTRQELADQLALSRNLTNKVKKEDESDSDSANVEYLTDQIFANDASNPWVNKQQESSKEVADFVTGYRKYWLEKNASNAKEHKILKDTDEHSEDEHANEHLENNELDNNIRNGNVKDIMLKSESKNIKKSKSHDKKNYLDNNKPDNKISIQNVKDQDILKNETIKNNKNKTRNKKKNCTSQLEPSPLCTKEKPEIILKLFDNVQDKVKNKVSKKIATLQREYDELNKDYKSQSELEDQSEDDELSKLQLRGKKRPTVHAELIETAPGKKPKVQDEEAEEIKDKTINVEGDKKNDSSTDIDPNKFFKAKPKHLITALPSIENGVDDIDDEEENEVQKMNIEEGFKDDDIIASFRKEKNIEIKKGQQSDIDLTLPGWGSWGGKNIAVPRQKKKRFIIKAPDNFPRRDENKGDIIISEFEDAKIKGHKVSVLPTPFKSAKEFEASIRAPIGNTFITETAHQGLIKPSITTKIGTIIAPMDEEELLKIHVGFGKKYFEKEEARKEAQETKEENSGGKNKKAKKGLPKFKKNIK